MDIGGDVVKHNETYLLKDNNALDNLTVSSTKLYPDRETRGHKHDGVDEVYIFTSGSGKIQLDDIAIPVKEGSVILIEGGVFHKVYNTSSLSNLDFICVLQGQRCH